METKLSFMLHTWEWKVSSKTPQMPSKVYATLEVDNFVNILLTGIVSSYVCACSVMPDSATPRTIARQVPQAMGFSRQE